MDTSNHVAHQNAEAFFTRKGKKLPKKFSIAYEVDGNYTVAVVSLTKKMFIGVAKRNPVDPVVVSRGKTIALIRALSKAMK